MSSQLWIRTQKEIFFEEGSLFEGLYQLRKQLRTIYEETWSHQLHQEWFFEPLSKFRVYGDDAESMDDAA
jgi:hypothetical protein